MLAQAVVCLAHAWLHPRLNVTVAVLDRLVLQPAGQGRLAVHLGKDRRDEIVVSRQTFPTFGVDHALGREDFTLPPEKAVFAAGLVTTQAVAPGAPRPKVNPPDRHRLAS